MSPESSACCGLGLSWQCVIVLEDNPLPPGRSGFEFIARLTELEHFASAHGAFNPDPYTGASGDAPVDLEKFGKISAEHRFASSSEVCPSRPYRSLNASRLKLSGSGNWKMSDYLEDILWLPFQEPAVLLHGERTTWDGPDFARESYDQNLELVKLWDAKNLLALFPDEHPSGHACRVFNAHKNDQVDRQIGDRRWINGAERHPRGPSAFLPSGPTTTSLHCPTSCKLVGCASDRKDFYHQASVSRERAHTNMLPFTFAAKDLKNTKAYKELLDELARPRNPDDEGDRYGMKPRTILAEKDLRHLHAGFKSLFQGDHLGVEYALSSHTTLLQHAGLLDPDTTICRHRPFPKGPVWQGLVIDDYFVVSREKTANDKFAAASLKYLEVAEDTYKADGVIGSDDKTVRGEECFKIIGAEVCSDAQARDRGVVTVGAPASKRIPLVVLSLKVAQMPIISKALASRLAGNWVSVLMFRRQLCCLLARLFDFNPKRASEGDDVFRLPRSVAEELVLASVMGLVAMADISVPYDTKLYATDASMDKGAITSKVVSPELASTLWLGGDRKGAYTMLDSYPRQLLRSLGCDEDHQPVAEDFQAPAKTLDFSFDAVEICGGSGTLSKALAARGLVVCPPIDLSSSKHYDIRDLRLVDWIFQMIKEKRFKSVICEPVCRTFSPAQHPASRSYANPTGFDRSNPKTFLGNLIAFRCLAILWFCWREGVIALLEQPLLSKMAWLSIWRFLLTLGFQEAKINSCAFGSIHKKPFRLLGYGLDMPGLCVPCPGGHKHVRIEGKYTKASAVYHPELAKFIAKKIHEAIERQATEAADLENKRAPSAFESAVLNDLLVSEGWCVEEEWTWNSPCHINILESRALVKLFEKKVLAGGDSRFTALLDSRVAKGAHAKGRSSARSLTPSLLRGCAYVVAGNLHPSYGFAPTRLNTADAPTRSRPLPLPASLSILDFLSEKQIVGLHATQVSKAAAGWIRLFLLLTVTSVAYGKPTISDSGVSLELDFGTHSSSLALDFLAWIWPWLDSFGLLSFGGFPGQSCGFGFLAGLRVLVGLWISVLCSVGLWRAFGLRLAGTSSDLASPNLRHPGHRSGFRAPLWFALVLLAHLSVVSAMPLSPDGAADAQRAERRAGTILRPDRVVLPRTRSHRETLLQAFDIWLAENWRTTLEELISPVSLDCEAVSEALISYGKDMFTSGKSYGRFSETINALTARRPALRRRIPAVWDLAFNWVVDEPHEHHTAMPLSVMLAFTSLALMWGWPRDAGVIALAWTGVCRIGEVLDALRSDLVLPQDAAPGFVGAILRIKQPKTRGRAAKHQSTKIDPKDIVDLLILVFGSLNPEERLWPWSPSTLRRRFNQLQCALGLTAGQGGAFPYGPSSLRPGGATYWLQLTEDAEYVRRKGRWISTKVLEVYLQETAFATYQATIPEVAKSRIRDLCGNFPSVLAKVAYFVSLNLHPQIWRRLW
eukprot:Skav208440  [mRNA]  locus=scaffold1952:165682:170177:- [translate_table: standard]